MDDIISLSSAFTTAVEWQDYCNKLKIELLHCQQRIKQLEYAAANPEEKVKTPEQIICELEIEKLRNSSLSRSLTLEETKRFDLLVKNLLLSREAQRNEKKEPVGPAITISEIDLINIARLPEINGNT